MRSKLTAIGVTAAAALALTPSLASASASSCVNTGSPASCVQVVGSGTRVDAIKAGVSLSPRQQVRGVLHVQVNDREVAAGPMTTFWNQSYFHRHTDWFDASISGTAANGTTVCAYLQEDTGKVFSRACVRIKA